MSASSKKLVFFFLCVCSFSFAQKKIEVKHYHNNDPLPIEEVRFLMVTTSDTINLPIVDGKIRLPKNFKENFKLLAQVKDKTIVVGSYRREMFEQLDIIIVGHITDFSVLKKSWEFKDSYLVDHKYMIKMHETEKIADLVYTIVQQDTNLSLHSNVKHYVPMFTSTYEILETK